MASFAYTAIAKDGRRSSGTLSADSRAAAIAQVVQQGLSPVSVKEQGGNGAAANGKSSLAAKWPALRPVLPAGGAGAAPAPAPAAESRGLPWQRGNRVSQRAVEAFTRELANLLAGGVSLARAMNLLRREASTPGAKRLWGEVHDEVVGGKSLADALAEHPQAFSTVYVAMVRAGEAGGFLDVVLGQIAEFRTREADLKGKVKAALVYPCVLAFLATAVVIFLLTFFIPKFSGIFAEFGADLPLLTRFIITASNIVKGYGIFVLIAVVGAVFGLRYAFRTDTGRRRLERTLLSVPLLGRIIANFALVRFARMLGTLTGAGVPLVASLRTAREAIGNQTLADTVSHAIEEVQRGSPLSKALGSSPKLFPASVVETIAVAEETGRLDKELVRVATSYEGDLDRQLRMLVSVAEPLLLVVMAGVIGTVVLGMLLPVFNLQNLVK